MVEKLGLVAAVVLPLWNIPLIARIIRRRSSADLSLWWVMGVWVCIVLMFPAGVKSSDTIWRTYTYINTLFFTAVMLVTVKYRKGM